MGVYDNLNNASVGSPALEQQRVGQERMDRMVAPTPSVSTPEPVNIFAQERQGYFANPRQRAVEDVGGVSVRDVREPVKSSPATAGNAGYTGGSGNGQSAVDYMQSLWTSPDEEKRLRKASVANQRVLAIGDALRHLGNIYNTVNGAPAQTFNSPVMEEYSRYEKGKALRDAANQRYLAYQQAKANQDALQKRWEADRDMKERQFRYTMSRDAAKLAADAKRHEDNMAWKDKDFGFKVQNAADQKAYKDATLAEQKRRTDITAGLQAERNNIMRNRGGGRTGQPFTFPTKNGRIELGRDLNTNAIGKKGLWNEMKKAGVIDDAWVKKFDGSGYTPEEKSALLNTVISQWLMTDDNAPEYMKKHFGATIVNSAQNNAGNKTMPGVGGNNTMPGVK